MNTLQEVYLCGKMPIKSEITMAENLQKGCHIANKFNFISCLQLSGKKWIFHVDLICNQYYFLKRALESVMCDVIKIRLLLQKAKSISIKLENIGIIVLSLIPGGGVYTTFRIKSL